MKERLKYIKTADLVLDIDLHNGYWIKAFAKYNYENRKYDVTFYIKENTIDKLALIETLDNVSLNATYKTIGSAILKFVSILLSEGYLTNSISNYEYEIRCFEQGLELLEERNIRRGGVA